jgi:hypothetical protein
MIEQIAIQHAKMKRVDWACVNEDRRTLGLNVPVLNSRLSRLPIGHGAWIQFYIFDDPARPYSSSVYGWLLLVPAGGLIRERWAAERVGPFRDWLKPWENFLNFKDYLGEKLPGLALSWKAYNESRLWC